MAQNLALAEGHLTCYSVLKWLLTAAGGQQMAILGDEVRARVFSYEAGTGELELLRIHACLSSLTCGV